MRFLSCLCLLLFAAFVSSAMAVEPERDGQEDSLTRAVYLDGRLWLLSDAGQLFSLTEADTDARREDAGGRVSDLCVSDGRLVALLSGDSRWTLRRWDAGAWRDQVSGAEHLGAASLACTASDLVLVTDKALINVQADQIRRVRIHGDLRYGVTTILARPDKLYIGFNMGEWGGGLQSIDRKSGRVKTIEKKIGKGYCLRPLDTGCDPVNGLAVMPWQPDCVAAAVGLVHMDVSGRVVKVCPDDVTVLYSKNFGERFANKEIPEEEAYQTMAFFGLTAAGDHLVAIGLDGLYNIYADGRVDVEAMPDYRQVGPFRVSFSRSDMVLVETTVNQRRSVSGPVPLMVPR